jgi:type I restriction enzyme M protein
VGFWRWLFRGAGSGPGIGRFFDGWLAIHIVGAAALQWLVPVPMNVAANSVLLPLWDAANTLRGSAVDRTDWKGYILPLLFFKRISDVWDEETAEAPRDVWRRRSRRFPEVHRFTVPEGCHWNDIRRRRPTSARPAEAMQEIERANPDTLYRVFGTADWGNKEKFTDELLKDLIEGFSEIRSATRRSAPTSSATPTST